MATTTGGTKLTFRLNQIAANLAKASTVDVGFMAGSTEPDGTSTPMVAAIQEYGAPKASIPPRPFFRTMITKESSAWPGMLGKALKANDYDSAKALDLMGQNIQEELQQSIADLMSPALSPITVMLRGMRSKGGPNFKVTGKTVGEAARRVADGKTNYGASTKPLVDSGTMLRSPTHLVK
jgi:hypothetical protein